MKIVVPVDTDKITIFQRTGKAPFFNIYENDTLIDTLVNNHSHNHEGEGNHSHELSKEEVEHHRQDIQNLMGCDVILAQAVGENMAKALDLIGLKVQKISKVDGTKDIEVVKKFLVQELKRQ
ncbi:hypothetical protein ALC152_18930 [Arcobacter sp. 15-2]|uniref:NifB/NifX family molybdenum-iron cluster-binding protein n=1 Tax=Arcobacter sp. 15-2 TaxID=3374109 RepID=UPI00399D0453